MDEAMDEGGREGGREGERKKRGERGREGERERVEGVKFSVKKWSEWITLEGQKIK